MNTLYEKPVIKPDVKTPHVEYAFVSPLTGKMKRFRPTFDTGRIKDPEAKIKTLIEKRNELDLKLQAGFNPFLHKLETFHVDVEDQTPCIQVAEAFEQILRIRENEQKKDGFTSYSSIANQFLAWLNLMDLEYMTVHQVKREHIIKYLNYKAQIGKFSVRTRFNHLAVLHALFEDTEKNALIPEDSLKNPCNKVDKKRSKAINSTARIIYTYHQVNRIKSYCQENDPLLLCFCNFITFAFLRPGTIRNLRVRMIDFPGNQFNIDPDIIKIGERENRIIQRVMMQTLKELNIRGLPGEYYIFGKDGLPGPKRCGEEYFRNRFKKVKRALNIPSKYDMYSLRHTFATDLVRSGQKWGKIMKITGHTSIVSFSKYVDFINADPAEDLSDSYSLSFAPASSK